jgi:hypothetical protein
LSTEAQHHYNLFLLLTEIGGLSLSDMTGEVYKEDLAYLLANQHFKAEAQNKWAGTDNAVRVRRH